MTNKEAIEILKMESSQASCRADFEEDEIFANKLRCYTEALDLAIQSLEKQEPEKPMGEIVERCPD